MKSVKKLNGSDLLEILILSKDLIYKHNEEGTIINPHPRNNFYNIQYKSSVNVYPLKS